MTDRLSDERVAWIADEFMDAPPNVYGPSGNEIVALAAEVRELREENQRLNRLLNPPMQSGSYPPHGSQMRPGREVEA